MQAKCTICGKRTVGKFRDHQLYPRKHNVDGNVCPGSDVPIVKEQKEEKIEVCENEDFKVKLMDAGGFKFHPDDHGFSIFVTQGALSLELFIDIDHKKIEITAYGKKSYRSSATLNQLVDMLRKL